MSTFDIASDAFASFKEILTKHKQMVAEFLDANYDQVNKAETGERDPCGINSSVVKQVLWAIQAIIDIRKLRDETTVAQIIGRDSAGQVQF